MLPSEVQYQNQRAWPKQSHPHYKNKKNLCQRFFIQITTMNLYVPRVSQQMCQLRHTCHCGKENHDTVFQLNWQGNKFTEHSTIQELGTKVSNMLFYMLSKQNEPFSESLKHMA